jgi:hypothetical protein
MRDIEHLKTVIAHTQNCTISHKRENQGFSFYLKDLEKMY